LFCRNINLIKQADPSQDGASSSSDGGSTCSSLQLQLLTVARVHEAMAEGLAGGAAQELGEPAAGTHALQQCITCLLVDSQPCCAKDSNDVVTDATCSCCCCSYDAQQQCVILPLERQAEIHAAGAAELVTLLQPIS
jgi:hypothetical protein